ncbi:MAG: hypothetical protein TREMPRED_003644 [Tremellales sp. Tagirdzhanova-0007]|nr:MAG: hypothetical protein TREMPRED_003644 [Tremellales sp. Tagirdzhanova-0007]
MALVTIVGYPCSGKSTRAVQLVSAVEKHLSDATYTGPRFRVVIVDDESNHIPRSVYDDSTAEKAGRASLFGAVMRSLGPDTITICDNLNYIKGFRYQMYCAARESHARVCTIHVATPPEKCREWHKGRNTSTYKPETFENLIMRFEEPSSMVRWDSPLFTIPWDDGLPFDVIWQSIMSGTKRPPTASVSVKPNPPVNTLQTLTSTTSTIITSILAHVNTSPTAIKYPIPSPPAMGGLIIRLPVRRLALPEMQRLKRQYEGVQTKGQISGGQATGNWTEGEVAAGFVAFLEAAWNTST